MSISRRHLLALVFSGFLLSSASPTLGKKRRIYKFTVDPEMQKEAQRLFPEAQALAKSRKMNLDGSDASIHVLESLLNQFSLEHEKGKLSKPTLLKYARIFGFYYGEVYRHHHGGTWGSVELDQIVPALRYSEEPGNDPFLVYSQIENRLLYGKDFDVAVRYFEIAEGH